MYTKIAFLQRFQFVKQPLNEVFHTATLFLLFTLFLCPTRTAGVVDVVYVYIVTWYVGCVWVGKSAMGGQFSADQEQEWMGVRTTDKEAGFPSK